MTGIADIGKQNRKLITADTREGILVREAAHRIVGAQAVLQSLGHPAQQNVAGAMTQSIIDLLESIQIEVEKRAGLFVFDRAFEYAVQLVEQHLSIGQAGQTVIESEAVLIGFGGQTVAQTQDQFTGIDRFAEKIRGAKL